MSREVPVVLDELYPFLHRRCRVPFTLQVIDVEGKRFSLLRPFVDSHVHEDLPADELRGRVCIDCQAPSGLVVSGRNVGWQPFEDGTKRDSRVYCPARVLD